LSSERVGGGQFLGCTGPGQVELEAELTKASRKVRGSQARLGSELS
jgi:hypothetical protein